MKPSAEQLAAACPRADRKLIDQHIERLSETYFQRFDLDQVGAHLCGLAELSRDRPVRVLLETLGDQRVSLTVLSQDYPGVFSLITGTLAGLGFSIDSGDVFTYGRSSGVGGAGGIRPRRGYPRRRRGAVKPAHRRRIIDHFTGTLDQDVDAQRFGEELEQTLGELIGRIEQDPQAGSIEARHRTNERVTRRLRHLADDRFPVLYPVKLDTQQGDDGLTHMTIVAQDTPAFLYSLTNALALMGMSIESVRASTHEGMVEDDIGFVDAKGNVVIDRGTLDRVRLAVLLTKQFTYYLDKSPDPYTALSRFEQIAEDVLRRDDPQWWAQTLSDPKSMRRLARLLGASDYLWEDFIRLQYEALLPILAKQHDEHAVAHDRQTIRTRLAAELSRATTPSEKRKALNRFKDQEVYRIDLDQILNTDTDFREFSYKLSALADAVVGAAAALAYRSLRSDHGEPIDAESGRPCPWSICGLGKLGGEALGYASDIELLFVYDGSGQTDGAEPIHVGEFYNLLAREVSNMIEAKQEGIFRVDLRVRPYGKNAPLAVSLPSMRKYYSPGGDALAWERMALVRLRPVAGDEPLGRRIGQMRDELVYRSEPPPLDELWRMRRMQWQQKKRPTGEFNAKYSPGALVDVEYAVQTLQVTYGHEHPKLRTPRIHVALEALVEANVLEGDDALMLRNAYRFMRQLINGLRMLRGNAEDLFVPPTHSPAFTYLARRMGYEPPDAAEGLKKDLDYHVRAVKQFVAHQFGPQALPDYKAADRAPGD